MFVATIFLSLSSSAIEDDPWIMFVSGFATSSLDWDSTLMGVNVFNLFWGFFEMLRLVFLLRVL